jgi:Spy/CpxP family protein refolding chaperone
MSTFAGAGQGALQRKIRFEWTSAQIVPKREEHRIMIEFTNAYFLARRTLLLASLLVAGSCALWAQADNPSGPPAGEMRHRGPDGERELAQLTQVLSLSGDQQTQVKAILAERRQKMEALHSGEAQPTREQMESVRKDSDAKISALLNDDQKAKFTAWQQQRMERRRGPGGDQAPTPPPAPQGV